MERKPLGALYIKLAVALGMLSVLVIACASPGGGPSILTDGVHHVLRDPPPDRVKSFPPADQAGVMVRDDVKGGYGMVRRMYVPQTVFPGKVDTDEPVLALNYVLLDWKDMGTGGEYKYVVLNQGDLAPFRKLAPLGMTCQDCLNRLPTQPNRQAPFFQPVRARIGNRDYWLVNDRFHGTKSGGKVVSAATLEIYKSDPTGGGGRPLAVWIFGSKEGPRSNTWDLRSGPWPLKGRFFQFTECKTDPQMDNRVTAVTIVPWEPKLSDILEGKTSAEILPRPYLSDAAKTNADLEAYLNEALIDWKAKEFPEYLRTASGTALRDTAVKLEKVILKLDLVAKELKDAADADARKVAAPGQPAPEKQAPAGALKTAHLLEQRKTILMVLLGPIKQVAAQKGA